MNRNERNEHLGKDNLQVGERCTDSPYTAQQSRTETVVGHTAWSCELVGSWRRWLARGAQPEVFVACMVTLPRAADGWQAG